MKATWSKLKTSGAWGVRIALEDPFEELPAAGTEVEVEKRDGTKQAKVLGAKVWSGEDGEGGLPVGLYSV